MLELATLGLLLREPLHGYRLKQQLELFMSSCISVNYGSIYPLLKRLEEGGQIATLLEEEGEAGPNRKIYSMTELGRDRWRQKMLEHPHESWVNSRSRFFIKFTFFNYLAPAERVKLLEYRLMVCKLRLESGKPGLIVADAYLGMAWDYFRQLLEGEIQWLTEQLDRERSHLTVHNSPFQFPHNL
ncbi:MAG: PadR family transcriptional regulator [Chamaesiphon sp.]